MAEIYEVGDIVKMKKKHPCGSFDWEILRVGADFRLKCVGCGHQIMIARKIVEFRKVKPLTTTFELVDIIKSAIPASKRKDGGHPAKRTFQALRIAVNDELNVLRHALEDALDLLDTNGRICVITFQSLEDRIVKETFKDASSGPTWKRGMPINLVEDEAKFKLITKHPIVASDNELENNNRAHSAKLRIVERI